MTTWSRDRLRPGAARAATRRAALPALLAEVPAGFAVIVVDNGSTRRHRRRGARGTAPGSSASRGPGTAPRCTPASWPRPRSTSRSWTATAPSTPPSCAPLLARRSRAGGADLALGRRRPVAPRRLAVARAARQRLVVWPGCGVRSASPAHDLAPMRVCRRADLLALDVRDRRFGYPLELLQQGDRRRLAARGARRRPTARAPPAPAPRSAARSAGPSRTAHDFWKVLARHARASGASPRPRSPDG